MGDPKALAALLLAMLLGAGCASARFALFDRFREPGETIRDLPEQVWEQYDCANQKRPYFIVEESTLSPQRVRPGGRFYHRIVYAMCPLRRTEVVTGKLVTRIRFRGRPIVESDEDYEIKPGRWAVDTFVDLPEDAEAGVYAYELYFHSGGIRFEKPVTFVVELR